MRNNVESKHRKDRVERSNKDGEIQLPVGHFALLNSHNNANNATKIAIYGLGSCIALILCDCVKKIGAMSHILLPKVKISRKSNPYLFPHKYAELSVKELHNTLLQHGATRKNMKAAIIGGANIFKDANLAIGTLNTEEVKHQLQTLNIDIVKEVVGGRRGRVIIYDIQDNSILVKVTGTHDFKRYSLARGRRIFRC